MYKKSQKINTNNEELSNFIENFDVFNSELILRLSDPTIEREDYEITVFEYRPDLIAEDIYGSTNYTGLLIFTTTRKLEMFKQGAVIKIIPKNTLDGLLSGIV